MGQVLARAKAAGIAGWCEIEALDDGTLERRLFGIETVNVAAMVRPEPDCAWIHRERHRPGVTLELLQQARRAGFRALYLRVSRLFEELALAHADGTYNRLLGRLAKIDVLDDWGLAPLKDQERRDLLEVFEDRHGLRSTVITSQLSVGNWMIISEIRQSRTSYSTESSTMRTASR